MSRHIAVLDIGSSKVVCLICQAEDDGTLVVRGAGVVGYAGFRYGKILNEKSLRGALSESITKAEREADRHINSVLVGVPSPFLDLAVSSARVQVTGKGGVSRRDVEALIAESHNFAAPAGFVPIHDTPISFDVDGALSYDMPIGVEGEWLGGVVSHMYADSLFVKLIRDVLSAMKIKVTAFISVPLAEAGFAVPDEVGAGDAILIDVGYMHTDVIWIRNGAVADMRVIDVGGCNFTHDIAYMFELPPIEAEKQKRNFVYSLDYADSVVSIKLPDEVVELSSSMVQEVIDARTSELADMILEEIANMDLDADELSPLYMTGGGVALMRGSCEFISEYMGVDIKVNMPWMPRLSSPNYASAHALMRFAANDETHSGGRASFLEKLKDFFTNS
ncbi:MAG: cell division FtsA domain-containing protein [Clostridia bacterium]|nr:cell division FtsA domain-containing protein [Clostridia bacterium]